MEYQAERAYLDMVEAGADPMEALREINRRNSNIAKVKEIKANLFADDARVERHSSGSLTSTAVIRAIECEKSARKRRLKRVRLEALGVIEEPPTIMLQSVKPEIGYRVVQEKGRAFSLEMIDGESTTLGLMEVMAERCRKLTGKWPTCILVIAERFVGMNSGIYQMGYFYTRDGLTRIPFEWAESNAAYDVKVVISSPEDDEWINDRKIA